eukprot:TRINITY_DN38081_c0_g1_i1.p1 TRINITY_DN38081_c0_g1~~TRINITY_DN38081_c0_g1_i1.p1  ORF type:complete len:238 (-),score=33.98 TRINITY_DN38081_c0_g1_i1:301-1014(-)
MLSQHLVHDLMNHSGSDAMTHPMFPAGQVTGFSAAYSFQKATPDAEPVVEVSHSSFAAGPRAFRGVAQQQHSVMGTTQMAVAATPEARERWRRVARKDGDVTVEHEAPTSELPAESFSSLPDLYPVPPPMSYDELASVTPATMMQVTGSALRGTTSHPPMLTASQPRQAIEAAPAGSSVSTPTRAGTVTPGAVVPASSTAVRSHPTYFGDSVNDWQRPHHSVGFGALSGLESVCCRR